MLKLQKYFKLFILASFLSFQFPVTFALEVLNKLPENTTVAANTSGASSNSGSSVSSGSSSSTNSATSTKLPSLPPNAAYKKDNAPFQQSSFYKKQMEVRKNAIINGDKTKGVLKFAALMAEWERAIRIIGYLIAFIYLIYYLTAMRKMVEKGEPGMTGISLAVSLFFITFLLNLNNAIKSLSKTFLPGMTCPEGNWTQCIQSSNSLLGLEKYLDADSVILQDNVVSNFKAVLMILTSIGVIAFIICLIKLISAGNKRNGYDAILTMGFFMMFAASIFLMNINDTLTYTVKFLYEMGNGL